MNVLTSAGYEPALEPAIMHAIVKPSDIDYL